MRRVCVWTVVGVIGLGLMAAPASADVKLPAILGSNMVLQQGAKVPFWGWADPGEKVTVSVAGQQATATAGQDGRWRVDLKPMKAGGEALTVTVQGKNKIELTNVLVGEVWVCSGQSNMNFRVRSCLNPKEEISAAKYPKIRFFWVPTTIGLEPKTDTKGAWAECSPKKVGMFSGTGYFFGRDLHKALGVPVGLIHTTVGGTPAEAWTSRPALDAQPVLKPALEAWDKGVADWPKHEPAWKERLAKWREKYVAWRKAMREPGAKKTRAPRRPRPPRGPLNTHLPAGLYNGMIAPLMPLAVKGAIWYQGESNAGRANEYRGVFSAMITDWRKNWGQGDFPFLFVQLADFGRGRNNWPWLREAQTQTLSLPNTGMAVIVDVGDATDIHPKNKQAVGKRLCLAAQHVAYGQDLVYSGPMYEAMKVEGGKIRLTFKHVGGGLKAKDGKLVGFTIAGADKKFVEAEAVVDGKTVVVSSTQVAEPAAVRYAWADDPECNLYNVEGLPACPFRTDTWERPAPKPKKRAPRKKSR